MGANPNPLGSQNHEPNHTHNHISRPGMGKDGPVLVVVVNNKKTYVQEAANKASRDPDWQGYGLEEAEGYHPCNEDHGNQEFVPTTELILSNKLLAEG